VIPVEEELDTWPAFVDILAGALTFLLLGFMALAAGHIRTEQQRVKAIVNEREAVLQRNRVMQASARSLGGEILNDLVAALKNDEAAKCTLEGNEVVCSFKGRLQFERSQWKLSDPSTRASLVGFGRSLKPYVAKGKVAGVEVEGHTDPDPTWSDMTNWELSTARAGHVVRLLEEGGVPGGCLTAIGYAQHNPPPGAKAYADRRLVRIRVLMRPEGASPTVASARCHLD
jgi:flagellar motor protein MotB